MTQPRKWKPNPGKQSDAVTISDFEVLYGGARGGGKTEAGLAFLIRDDYHLNARYRALVIRRNADDLRDWLDRARDFFGMLGGIVGGDGQIKFPSGAVIRTGHLKDDNAYRKYQGHEYHRILIEELTHIPALENYLMLISSCRSTVPGLVPQIFATTNPDGPGHKWVMARWNIQGTPQDKISVFDTDRRSWRVFVPAKLEDNPILMNADPAYAGFLNSLPDGLRDQWRWGSWDEFEVKGAYYTAEVAQLKREGRFKFVPFDPMLKVHVVLDLGLSAGNAMAMGLYQRISTELRMLGYYSNEGFGLNHYWAYLQRLSMERGYVYGKHFAPHDINNRELSTGKTRIQAAKDMGWNLEAIPMLGVADGIEQARIAFPKLWVNNLEGYGGDIFLDAIRQYKRKWDEARRTYGAQPVHDWTSNPADMFRYTALIESKMTNEVNKKSFKQKPYIRTTPYEGGLAPK